MVQFEPRLKLYNGNGLSLENDGKSDLPGIVSLVNVASDKKQIRFLDDQPANKDEMDSHHSIAEAIASTVVSKAAGKSVLLAGGWGAGKSTVINLLSNRLKEFGKIKSHVFVFDAWAHSGEQLRRNFLEKLIDELCDVKSPWLDKEKWKKKRDGLIGKIVKSKTTIDPRLTGLGVLLVLSLILSPVAWSAQTHIEPDEYADLLRAIAWVIGYSPIAVVLCAIPYWIGKRVSAKSDDEKKVAKNILLQLVRDTQSETESNSRETPEPTSVEFENMFEELIQECLQANNRRLVVVFDNLDRLESQIATELWGAIRTFLGHSSSGDSVRDRMWVIVPLDPAFVEKMWPNSEEVDAGRSSTAHEMRHKTFQIEFPVPNPSLARWIKYFDEQAKSAFSWLETDPDQLHDLRRVYEFHMEEQRRTPTPRQIKAFLNRVAALYLIHEDKVLLAALALYVVEDGGPAWKISPFLRNEKNYPTDLQEILGDNLISDLACIHYNQDRDASLQIAYGSVIQMILNGGEVDLAKYIGTPAFWSVCQSAISSKEGDWKKGSTSSLVELVTALIREIDPKDDAKAARVLASLKTHIDIINPWQHSVVLPGHIIAWRIKENPSLEILKELTSRYWNILGQFEEFDDTTNERIDEWISGAREILEALEADNVDDVCEHLTVFVPHQSYVPLLNRILPLKLDRKLARAFRPYSGQGVADWIVTAIPASPNVLPSREVFDFIANSCPDNDWTGAMKSCLDQLSNLDQDVKLAERCLSYLRVLRQLDKTKSEDFVSTMADNGTFLHWHQVLIQKDSTEIAAWCLYQSIMFRPNLGSGVMPGQAATASQFYGRHSELLEEAPDIIRHLITIASAENQVNELLSKLAVLPDASVVFCQMLRSLSSNKDQRNAVRPETLISYIKSNLSWKWEHVHEFLKFSKQSHELCRELESQGFEIGLSRIYLEISRPKTKKNRELFIEFLVNSLRGLSESTWHNAMTSEHEVLELTAEASREGWGLELELEFQGALHEYSVKLLAGQVQPKKIDMWQDQMGAMANSTCMTFKRNCRDLIKKSLESGTGDSLALTKLFGDELLPCDILVQDADHMIRTTFRAVVERLKSAELLWTIELLERCPKLVSAGHEESREDLSQRIKAKIGELPEENENRDNLVKISELIEH